MPKILLVDDDPVLLRIMPAQLRRHGYAVETATSLAGLEKLLAAGGADLLLLDVVLPDGDGRAFCRALRGRPATEALPVILISATKRGTGDQADGLKSGADDYLIKPLVPRLLLAKIEAVLRRFSVLNSSTQVLEEYGLALDMQSRRVRRGRREVSLTRKEFDLLSSFLRARGKVLAAAGLLESVWGYDLSLYSDTRTVEVHVSSLRRKLGKKFSTRLRTVSGAGYILD